MVGVVGGTGLIGYRLWNTPVAASSAEAHVSDAANTSSVDVESIYIDISNFMSEPVTPIPTLDANKEDMKTKMELFIMKVQVIEQLCL